MARPNWPDKIEVTLGSQWNPGGLGNGLSRGDVVVLTRAPGTDVYYEDPNGDSSANQSTNRIKADFFPNNPVVGVGMEMQCCKYGSDAWGNNLVYMQFSSRQTAFTRTYVFGSIWRAGSPSPVAPPSTPYPIIVWYAWQYRDNAHRPPSIFTNTIYYLWSGSTGGGSSLPQAMSHYKEIFSTFEEYSPGRAPDKTTFRYG